ncbi:MAG: oxygen-independent coproporphyrinogen III oxidase [Verrucomicrobiales bacterium]|nr:oxygen-independent coproporphyrinogen III oxidase [Verrucomicrobiales bacterium]
MSGLHVDLDLIRKYNVAGPRYTSYPPANRFTEEFSEAQAAEELDASNRVPRDLSLYFHIPFCETLCWFCGCTTVITLNHQNGGTYVEHLEREIALVAPRLHAQRQAVQLHWGGGSPTFLAPDEIRRLGRAIHQHFHLADDLEASVEIDPRRLQQDHVVALKEIGFNRASLGVQDFDPEVQLAVHRIQPKEMTAQVIQWIRDAGFRSLNIDLIYGLPHQTVDSFRRTLDIILELRPDRLAVFNYAHVPWMKPSQKIFEKRQALPSPAVKLDLLKLVVETLTDAGGYTCIGMDHFALPTDELATAQASRTLQRNFQGYSTRGGADICAFGMSAISQTEDAYWQNIKPLEEYYAAVTQGRLPVARGCRVNRDDQIRRAAIMEIMCNLGIDFATMDARLGINFASYFTTELAGFSDMVADGLVRLDSSGISVTDLGRLLVRNIAMRFDTHLPKTAEPRFSRTI